MSASGVSEMFHIGGKVPKKLIVFAEFVVFADGGDEGEGHSFHTTVKVFVCRVKMPLRKRKGTKKINPSFIQFPNVILPKYVPVLQ